MNEFVKATSVNEVPEGGMKLVEAHGSKVVLANIAGDIVAFGNDCPHAGCPLADEGELDGEELECHCHGSRFNVRSGEVLEGPAEEPLTRFAVRLQERDILVGPEVTR